MKKIIAVAVVGLMSVAAQATNIGVTAEIGTTGLGAHVVVPVAQDLNFRAGINAFDYRYNGSTSDVKYDFKLKLQTWDALADYYPMSGSFRVTGGLVYNANKITANGKPTAAGSYTINGHTYTASEVGSLNGNIDFRKVSPYLGIGWGNAVGKDKGFGLTADLGVLFQGSPRTSLANNGCTASAAVCDQIANDVAAENSRLKDEVKSFNAYPVVRVGLSYRF